MTINDPRDNPKNQVTGKGYRPAIDRSDAGIVDAIAVNKFHQNSDVDSSQTAQHHTIGTKQDQVSSGAHTHNGKNSRLILEGTTISGDRSDGTALQSVIAALVKLGATDTTVA